MHVDRLHALVQLATRLSGTAGIDGRCSHWGDQAVICIECDSLLPFAAMWSLWWPPSSIPRVPVRGCDDS